MKKIDAGLIPISAGIILTNFDFTYDSFGRFDLSPGFVGYGLTAMGLGRWTGLSKQFAIARLCAWTLIPVDIIRWLCPLALLQFFDFMDAAINASMIWTLLSGIKVYSARENQPYLLKWSSVYRVAYIGLFLVIPALVIVASLVLPPPSELGMRFAIGLVTGFFWIISPFIILDLLFQFNRILNRHSFSQ